LILHLAELNPGLKIKYSLNDNYFPLS